jgi:hypothetical protein
VGSFSQGLISTNSCETSSRVRPGCFVEMRRYAIRTALPKSSRSVSSSVSGAYMSRTRHLRPETTTRIMPSVLIDVRVPGSL